MLTEKVLPFEDKKGLKDETGMGFFLLVLDWYCRFSKMLSNLQWEAFLCVHISYTSYVVCVIWVPFKICS